MTIQWRAILPVILGAAIWLIPVPAGLTSTAWTYFALCVAVIAALISEPIPGPVAGLLGITAAAALNLVAANPDDSIRWALSGFSNGTVWLIFVAFMFGLGYQKTARPSDRAQSRALTGAAHDWSRLCDCLCRPRLGAFHAVEHGAQRWHDIPHHQEHSGALWITTWCQDPWHRWLHHVDRLRGASDHQLHVSHW